MIVLQLWQLLVLVVVVPACWHGWAWVFRVLAVVVGAKAVGAAKDKAMSALKGEGKA